MDPHTVMYRDDRPVKHIKTWTHTHSCIEMIDLSSALRHGPYKVMYRDDRLVKHIKTWTHTHSCIEMIDLSNTLRHGRTHSHV
jgi:sarcosine oxidase delta subunit